MSDAFISQIAMYGFTFAPKYWAQCNGQILAIAQNQALFSLLGTTFGGNGVQNFQLPDLRGRTPMHRDTGSNPIGATAGVENVTLATTQMPTHLHAVMVSSTTGTTNVPTANVLATSPAADKLLYGPPNALTAMSAAALANVGGNAPHNNMQPSLVINFCICLSGVFPSRN